jgi:serine/threonine protein kinase
MLGFAVRSSRSGDRFAGRYELREEVGAGGMGTVYRAIDRDSDLPVAVKIVRVADPGDEARFEREAAALGGVEHPAVVRYLAHGREHGAHYLVMEWLAGRTLDAHLADVGISMAESVEVVARVAAGLAAVHARGLVHRDIKPHNLMLVGGAHDRVTILDFGVARPTANRGIVTNTGRTVGTPGYMSPEQTRGDRALDARSDIFSLGCVLYECLTGRAPFPGEHPTAVCTKILLQEPPELGSLCPEVPPGLRALVDACLSKNPDQRPVDAIELARRLAALPVIDPGLPRRLPFRAVATLPDRRAHDPEALISIVLALPAAAPPGLFDVARRLGARADMLADGTVLLELSGGGALHHAESVSSLVALLGPGIVAVATGAAGHDARSEVTERAARSFEAEGIVAALSVAVPRGAVRTDAETVGLLSPPLEAILGRASYLLTGGR